MTIDSRGGRPTRRDICGGLLTISACAATKGARADDGPPAVEGRIARILAGLRPPVAIEGEPTTTLQHRMDELHVPGVSITVIHNGAIDWARGFGVTEKGGAPITQDTLFQAGSISKSVAAAAVLSLVQNGGLDLDADATSYLKSWRLPPSPLLQDQKVTLRELLSHSAGTTVHGFGGYAATAPRPTLIEVLDGAPPANSAPIVVDLPPGKQFRYSGGGYTIVQQILIDVTGKPFADLLKETVLGPVGMARSSFDQPLPATELAYAALPNDENGDPLADGPHVYPELAAAGLWTTPTDLARFMLALRDAWQGNAAQFLSQTAAEQMLTPVLEHYGLGLSVGGKTPHRRFSHEGVNYGFQSAMIAYENGDGAAIMTSSDNGLALAGDILRSIAVEYGWVNWLLRVRKRISVDPKLLDGLVGTYRLTPQIVVTVSSEAGHLFLQLTGQDKLEFFPESNRSFFTTAVDAVVTFDTDGSTPATQLVLHQNGHDSAAPRLP